MLEHTMTVSKTTDERTSTPYHYKSCVKAGIKQNKLNKAFPYPIKKDQMYTRKCFTSKQELHLEQNHFISMCPIEKFLSKY